MYILFYFVFIVQQHSQVTSLTVLGLNCLSITRPLLMTVNLMYLFIYVEDNYLLSAH